MAFEEQVVQLGPHHLDQHRPEAGTICLDAKTALARSLDKAPQIIGQGRQRCHLAQEKAIKGNKLSGIKLPSTIMPRFQGDCLVNRKDTM